MSQRDNSQEIIQPYADTTDQPSRVYCHAHL
jgi:hypothetical protein